MCIVFIVLEVHFVFVHKAERVSMCVNISHLVEKDDILHVFILTDATPHSTYERG